MRIDGAYLFQLLPEVYRLRDAEVAAAQGLPQGTPGPLQSLLTVIGEQTAVVSDSLDQLYDDQFIETCAPWVIPYIGDLIGYNAIHGAARGLSTPRAEVAHTLTYRRRKGTLLVLEQLARDATGWGACAVEFFRLLATTQYMQHIRPGLGGTAHLRPPKLASTLGGAWDSAAHLVDVRAADSGQPRPQIGNLGLFLWTLPSWTLTEVPATAATGAPAGGARCFRFHPLGVDAPLYTAAQDLTEDPTTGLAPAAGPVNVAAPLTRAMLCEDLRSAAGTFYGPGRSLSVSLDGKEPLATFELAVANLAGAEGAWANLPAKGSPYAAVIDPELGRLAVPPGSAATPLLSFAYPFPAELGGGPYPRLATFAAPAEAPVLRVPADYPTLSAALAALPSTGDAAVELSGNGTYSEAAGLTIHVPAHGVVELRAADGSRPTLLLGAPITVSGGELSSFAINGLLVTLAPADSTKLPPAMLHVPADDNQLASLTIAHSTLVPGWSLAPNLAPAQPAQPAIVAELAGLSLQITRSVVGSLVTHTLATVAVTDSILDACSRSRPAYAGLAPGTGGAPLTLQGVTVFGQLHAAWFPLVSNCLLLAEPSAANPVALVSDRLQAGCFRFSLLPWSSSIPSAYECFSSPPEPLLPTRRYGAPGYARLLPSTSARIRQGADDGGEMGAFHFALFPLREADLRTRLAEYMPANLALGLIFVT